MCLGDVDCASFFLLDTTRTNPTYGLSLWSVAHVFDRFASTAKDFWIPPKSLCNMKNCDLSHTCFLLVSPACDRYSHRISFFFAPRPWTTSGSPVCEILPRMAVEPTAILMLLAFHVNYMVTGVSVAARQFIYGALKRSKLNFHLNSGVGSSS